MEEFKERLIRDVVDLEAALRAALIAHEVPEVNLELGVKCIAGYASAIASLTTAIKNLQEMESHSASKERN